MTNSPSGESRWRQSPIAYGPNIGWQLLFVLLAGLFLFLFASIFLQAPPVILGALMFVWALLTVVWHWPYPATIALVVGGSVHQFAMLLLLHFTNSPSLVKAAQLWKEGVVIALLVMVINQALRRRVAPRLDLLDLLVLFFMAWCTFYLLFPSSVEGAGLGTKLFGLRLDAFALAAYFVGRGLTITKSQIRTLLLAFAGIVALIAAIAVIEFVLPNQTNALFNSLGQQQFTSLSLGDTASGTTVRFNSLAGYAVPRASSLLLSDLGLAFYMLLGVPLAAALCFGFSTGRRSTVLVVFLALTVAATVVTLTRSAMLALVPLLLMMAALSHRLTKLLVAGSAAALAGLLIGFFLNIPDKLLAAMFSTDEGSFRAHIGALQASIALIQQDPLGRGLGTAGSVSQRFALAGGITNESWYFQLATEIGVVGAVIWSAVLLAFFIVAWRRFTQASDPWLKCLCLTMVGSAAGFALVSATLHAWSGLATSIIFWLLAGLVVSGHSGHGVSTAIATPAPPTVGSLPGSQA